MTTIHPAAPAVPVSTADPINARILSVSEDALQGFHEEPFLEIARRAELDPGVVLERLRAMLAAGTIRRIRQTLLANNLAPGALVAWAVPAERLDFAFAFMADEDPFSGHVVVRTTDEDTPGSRFRLWTTLKVPHPYSLERHCRYLAERTGATEFRTLPAKKLFALGVGHVRRRDLAPGARSDEPGAVLDPAVIDLTDADWRVLVALKGDFRADEIGHSPWAARAAAIGMTPDAFVRVANSLRERGVIGRFSTFLEHTRPNAAGERVTRYNVLFHWRVPPGREVDAGREVGRHHVMTHAYWREGGEDFAHVNVMGVAHGREKGAVLEHKAAIDRHLEEAGIPVLYTNVFWGGKNDIRPSEVSPLAYAEWAAGRGL